MDLKTLIETVTSSNKEMWHTISCWGASSGPSYRDHLQFHQVYNGQKNVLYVDAHGTVATYKPDISITMAWGLEWLEDFQEPWANSFPDRNASGHYVDLFYNSALVFRAAYVAVDGGGVYLPLPRGKTVLEVPQAHYNLIGLLDSLTRGRSEFASAFRRAGFKVIDAPWPESESD